MPVRKKLFGSAPRTQLKRRNYRRGKRNIGRRAKRRPGNLKKSNAEVKQIEQTNVHSQNLVPMVGSEHYGPSNTIIFLDAYHCKDGPASQLQNGFGVSECVGRWITPAYPSSAKYSISYGSLTGSSGHFPSPNLMMVQGHLKMSGSKIDADLTTVNSWLASCLAKVKHELFHSGFSGDFLSFKELNRDIIITRRQKIYPQRTTAVQDVAAATVIVSPDKNITTRIKHGSYKTRIEGLTTLGVNQLVCNNLWIPFTMFKWDNASVHAGGNIPIKQLTKCWFRDT